MSDEQRLSDEDIDKIANKVLDKITADRWVGTERHWDEHEWLKAYMQGRSENRNRRQRIIDKVVGSVGVAITLGFLAWVGHAMLVQAALMIKKLNL